MGGGNELRHQIVQCLKNVGFGMVQALSCTLPRNGEGVLHQPKAVRPLCSWLRPPSQLCLHSRAPCQVGRHSRGIREVVQEEKGVSNSAQELLESRLGECGSPERGQES